MPALTPIVRTSLKEPLLSRYNASKDLANVGGGSATDAGLAKTAVVNPNTQAIQSDFTERQPVQVTEFTPKALDYGASIGVDTTRYNG